MRSVEWVSEKAEAKDRPIAIYGAIVANAIIAISKFIVAGITGSSSIMAEAIHSVTDTGNELLLLFGVKRSGKPPDEKHPFGYGKELYFWSLIVAMLLFGVGGGFSVYEGIHQLQHPVELGKIIWSYGVLAVALIAESISLAIALRQLGKEKGFRRGVLSAFQRSKDPARFVVVGEDTAAVLGILIAAAGVTLSHLLKAPWIDGVAAILIGCVLFGVALLLIFESRALILGEAAAPDVLAKARAVIDEVMGQERRSRVSTMQLGADSVLMVVDLDMPKAVPGEEALARTRKIRDGIRRECPQVERLSVSIP